MQLENIAGQKFHLAGCFHYAGKVLSITLVIQSLKISENLMFSGSIVALVTPMHDDGSVDYAALAKLVEFHIENKTQAIVSVGTTGESATLSHEEDSEVTRKVVEYVNGRIPVIAGTGSNSTSEAISLTAEAKSAGADACLIVAPYYNRPPQEGMYQHFKSIAEAVDIPIILYNVPKRTSSDIETDTVIRLAQIDNIIGIKDATADMSRVKPMRQACGDNFVLLSGDDGSFFDYMVEGGQGVISVAANVAPAHTQQVCELALAGKISEAREKNQQLQGLYDAMGCDTNPIPVKWALHEMGLIDAGIRLPLIKLPQAKRAVVQQAIANL